MNQLWQGKAVSFGLVAFQRFKVPFDGWDDLIPFLLVNENKDRLSMLSIICLVLFIWNKYCSNIPSTHKTEIVYSHSSFQVGMILPSEYPTVIVLKRWFHWLIYELFFFLPFFFSHFTILKWSLTVKSGLAVKMIYISSFILYSTRLL